MLFWLLVVALAFVIGFTSIRAWWIERPNFFYASKAVHNQEDEEWWRGIELERLHEVNREYVERLLRQIDGAGVGTLTSEERAFMERMAKLEAPSRPGVRPPIDPCPSPA
jgi:hypothetical protein